VIFKEEDDDGRERVTEEEERVSINYEVSQQLNQISLYGHYSK